MNTGTRSDGSGPDRPESPSRDQPVDYPPAAAKQAGFVLDTRGTIVTWTIAAERLLGYQAAEILGRPISEILTEPAPEFLDHHDEAAEAWSGVRSARHRDGHSVRLAISAWRLMPEQSNSGWFLLCYDIGDTPWWAVSTSLLRQVLEHTPVGIAVFDTELRYLWVNPELRRFSGVGLAERVGRTFRQVQPMMDVDAVEAALLRVLETGEPVLNWQVTGRTQVSPHETHVWSMSLFRLDDATDTPRGVCCVAIDVTSRWRAQERLALLAEAGARIGTTMDVSRTAQELADFAVPRLADFVTVDLFESLYRGDEPGPVSVRGMVNLRRAGQASVRRGVPEAVVRIGDLAGHWPDTPVSRCLIEGRPYLQKHIPPDTPWLARDPTRAARIREFGLHSLMVLPIRAREATLGAVNFWRWQRPESFDEQDMTLAAEVVARGAICVDNARRYTREHAGALDLQRSLLPHPEVRGIDLPIATRYFPADPTSGVGGDWFDVIPLSGARVAMVVGDVVGHGINAAATMGRLRTAVRALTDMELPPDELLAHLDDLAIRFIDEEPENHAAVTALLGSTCLVLVLDLVSCACTVARAGHPPPAIVSPDGAVSFPDIPDCPPLGIGTLPFETAEFVVPEGSLLVLYTDGLIEGVDHGNIDIGFSRLRAALARPTASVEEVCDAVVDSLVVEQPRDDVAVLVVRAHMLPPERVVSYDLPLDPAVVADARALTISTVKDRWGLYEIAPITELIVSELVTNAIRYASGPIQLRLIRHTVLICEVSDTSGTSPRLRHARTTDEGGRGLFLVAQLAKRWGTRYTSSGKIIWAEQSLDESSDVAAP